MVSAAGDTGGVRVIVFTLDQHRFAVPVSRAQRVVLAVEISPIEAAPPSIAGAANVGGFLIPVIDARSCLNLRPREIALSDHFLFVEAGGQTVILMTDGVSSVLERGAGTECRDPAPDELVAGPAIAGMLDFDEGPVALIDVDRILDGAQWTQLGEAMESVRNA